MGIKEFYEKAKRPLAFASFSVLGLSLLSGHILNKYEMYNRTLLDNPHSKKIEDIREVKNIALYASALCLLGAGAYKISDWGEDKEKEEKQNPLEKELKESN